MVLHARVVTGTGGGPEKTILNSSRFLDRLGYDAKCLYLRPPEDPGFEILRSRASALNAGLVEVDDRGPFDRNVVSKSIEVCQKYNVAIWHAHDYKTNLLGLLVKRKWPMKLVTTVHGWVEVTLRNRVYKFVDRLTLPKYDRVMAVSSDLLKIARSYGVPAEKSVLIENAIDTEVFRRGTTTVPAKVKLGIDPNRLLIGAVGRLSDEKGFERLIRSVKVLVDRGLDVQLAIIGEGSLYDTLQQVIVSLDLQDRVRLAGFQADPSPWYEAMDVFALSSFREGLPNVVLEAMALETPVVTTAVAGVPNVITDGVNGLVVPVDDDTALTNALSMILGDASLRGRLATKGRKTIEDRYSFANRMKNVASLYDGLLNGGTSPTANDFARQDPS